MDLQKLVLVAAQELTEHNLVGWTFTFGDSKRRLGVCKYRSKRIELSEFYASHSADEHVLDTLRHEIAHALVGPGAIGLPRLPADAPPVQTPPEFERLPLSLHGSFCSDIRIQR